MHHVNVAAYLDDVAAAQPQTLAVAVADGRGAFHELTAADLAARAHHAARALASVGVQQGTRVALMVTPSPAFFALTFALFRLGAVPVMVDPGMGIKNLGACLDEAAPEVFIGVPRAQLARMALRWASRSVRTVITVGTRPLWRGLSFDKLLAQTPQGDAPLAQITADDLAAILFTSGSTGVPKGAEYTYGIFAAQVRLLRDTYGIEPGEVDLSTFPLFALFSPALGMASVVPEMDASRPGRANPARLFEAMERYRCTNVFANPALIDKLGRYGLQHRRNLPPSVRRVLSAGAPASVPALRRFAHLLPPGAQVHTPYGATEALPVASIGSDAILHETAALTDQGRGVCVGHPVPGVQVDIIRIDDGPLDAWSDDLRLPPGQIGEIVVKGPIVTRRYFRRDEATRLAKLQDGDAVRHRMGDVGWIDDQGRLWMCGRKAHRVTTPQGDLFTLPCEAVFNTHPKVFRTALVGVQRGGVTTPLLWVELEAPHRHTDPQDLFRELAALGAQHPHTQTIQTFLLHPGFPVDVRHNAKIFREALAREAQQRLA